MRTFLLSVLIAVISLPAFAIEKTKSQPQQTQLSSTARPQEAQPIPVRAKLKLRLSQDNDVCYTLHSLQVERDPGSDVTRLVRQRTCTPSGQFQMKSTVQRSK